MKKILSLFVAAAMILSLMFVCVITASAAGEGDWDVYSSRGSYEDKDDPNKRPVPGYEYTEDGLHMIPADWSESTPWGIFQTKEQVNLREGVYMEVRIDNFTYEGDKWFAFNIWEEKIDEFPDASDKSAIGLEALVRVDGNKKITSVPLNIHTKYGESTTLSYMGMMDVKNVYDDNGCPIVTLQITWDETTGYSMYVNGATLSTKDAQTMTDIFDGEDNDGYAYISFSLQNSTKGGTVECTVLKFGTSPEDCEKPTGSDSAKPVDNKITIADIADPSTVPAGEPAVFLNGSVGDSDIMSKPSSTNNSTIIINDDNSVTVNTTTTWASVSMSVNNDVSYDAADFPMMLIIARNLCTCVWQDGTPSCDCSEMPGVITMAGDTIAADSANTIKAYSYIWEPICDEDGNMYSYFIADWSDFSGRINGFRIDLQGMKTTEAGRTGFDIMGVGFFRTDVEAQEFFEDYLVEIGVLEGEDDPAPSESEETTDVGESESETVNADTETEGKSDEVSVEETEEEKTEGESATEGETKKAKEQTTAKIGCGGVIGTGSVALIIALMASVLPVLKKREK